MAKQKVKMVQCRYPKCMKLHESTELPKDEAVQGGKQKYYYHPDCYHIMQTINQIKDQFYREINPNMTGKQIGQLVSIVNNIVFTKGNDVDFVKFALEYFIKYKPGALKYPGGMAYIVQDRDVLSAWEKLQAQKIREELRKEMDKINDDDKGEIIGFDSSNKKIEYKDNRKNKFSNVLGV